jgi:hypothetical protein
VINFLQAEIALHELTQVSRQQVLNLITPDVMDDGWLASQGAFEPYVLIVEAATRELSKPHVGFQLHTRFPVLKIKRRPARTARGRCLIWMMLGPNMPTLMAGFDDLPDQRDQALLCTAGGVSDDIKRDFDLHDAVAPEQRFMLGEDLQWPVVLRTDEGDDGPHPRILALIGCNVEAVADLPQDKKESRF